MQNRNIDEQTAMIVNEIFEGLLAMHPAYRQAWPNEETFNATKRQWIIAFMHQGLSDIRRVRKGLERARNHPSDFVPSVGQFMTWCKLDAEDIGAPSLDDAYSEACKNAHPCAGERHWSHIAVRLASQGVGSHRLRTEARDKTYKDFARHYEKYIQEFIDNRVMDRIEDATLETKEEEKKLEIAKDFHHVKSHKDAMKEISKILNIRKKEDSDNK